MKTTPKQTELWKLATAKISELGGIRGAQRKPETKIEGTREWAIVKAFMATNAPKMPDDESCQILIDAILQ